MQLELSPGSLVVFVDDTGHEALVEGHPVYGLGGCAVMAPELDRLIRQPWREVRRHVTGSDDTPLHAWRFGRSATKEQIGTVGEFFRAQPFARLGAILTIDTAMTIDPALASEREPIQTTIATVLMKRIADIARWTPFQELHVILESSERADPSVEKAFQGFGLQRDGNPIPVKCSFMSKSAGEPGLEVADFVMHAVGRQARHKLQRREGVVPDFKAIFHTVDEKLASFMLVDDATIDRAEAD